MNLLPLTALATLNTCNLQQSCLHSALHYTESVYPMYVSNPRKDTKDGSQDAKRVSSLQGRISVLDRNTGSVTKDDSILLIQRHEEVAAKGSNGGDEQVQERK
jgi:hypothetical protein